MGVVVIVGTFYFRNVKWDFISAYRIMLNVEYDTVQK